MIFNNFEKNISNLPTEIKFIRYKFTFNICKLCKNKHISNDELYKKCPNFTCRFCNIEKNKKNNKIKHIFDLY